MEYVLERAYTLESDGNVRKALRLTRPRSALTSVLARTELLGTPAWRVTAYVRRLEARTDYVLFRLSTRMEPDGLSSSAIARATELLGLFADAVPIARGAYSCGARSPPRLNTTTPASFSLEIVTNIRYATRGPPIRPLAARILRALPSSTEPTRIFLTYTLDR